MSENFLFCENNIHEEVTRFWLRTRRTPLSYEQEILCRICASSTCCKKFAFCSLCVLLNQAGLWLFSFLFMSPTILCSGLPVCNFKCLTNKEIIHKGAYGTLFTADWQTLPGAGGKSAAAEKVVAKKLLDEDILDKKTFVKEGRIIQELKHPNIVKFKGICNNPFALILGYVYFDFQPFGFESKVSFLAEFLGVLECSDCDGFVTPQVISTIFKDVALGLKHVRPSWFKAG